MRNFGLLAILRLTRDIKLGLALLCCVSLACGPAVDSGESAADDTSGATGASTTSEVGDETRATDDISTSSASTTVGATTTSAESTDAMPTTDSSGETSGDSSAVCPPAPPPTTSLCGVLRLQAYGERVFLRDGVAVPQQPCSGKFAPCGGVVAGTSWTLSSACVPQFITFPWICEAQDYSATESDEISLTFEESNYSGLHSQTWTLDFEASAASCDAETCAQVEACLNEHPYNDAECSGTDNCTCTLVFAFEDEEFGGAYSIENDTLVVGGPGWFEPLGRHPYCRNGDVLTIWSPQYAWELTEQTCETDEDCSHLTSDPPDDRPGECFEL